MFQIDIRMVLVHERCQETGWLFLLLIENLGIIIFVFHKRKPEHFPVSQQNSMFHANNTSFECSSSFPPIRHCVFSCIRKQNSFLLQLQCVDLLLNLILLMINLIPSYQKYLGKNLYLISYFGQHEYIAHVCQNMQKEKLPRNTLKIMEISGD